MSQEEFERFRQLVLVDDSLQQQLRETPDRAAFFNLVLRLGRERGCQFTAEDVEDALLEGRRSWIQRWIIW